MTKLQSHFSSCCKGNKFTTFPSFSTILPYVIILPLKTSVVAGWVLNFLSQWHELSIRHINMDLRVLMQLVAGNHMQMLNQSKRSVNVLVVMLRSALMQQKCFWQNRGLKEGTRCYMSTGVPPISDPRYVPANTHWQPCCQMSPFKIRQRPGFPKGEKNTSHLSNTMRSVWLPCLHCQLIPTLGCMYSIHSAVFQLLCESLDWFHWWVDAHLWFPKALLK